MNALNYLDFEKPIVELLAKIEELKHVSEQVSEGVEGVDLSKEIALLNQKDLELTKKIFSNLDAWQICRLARHPMRPYTKDYVSRIFTDFEELSGDRAFADDPSILCGIARLDGEPCAVIGEQKGRDTQEKIRYNFGMPRPEGYRKAVRVMRLAERFSMPVFTFIDTPGAYPGVGAEERGQAEAIAKSIQVMSALKVPTICTVIGEGGSGGALAIGVGNRVNMMQYSTYSVISPEGCASILWKDAEKAPVAAEAMHMTAHDLKSLDLVDTVIDEPLGGAHRDYDTAAESLHKCLSHDLEELRKLSPDELAAQRYERLMKFGVYETAE